MYIASGFGGGFGLGGKPLQPDRNPFEVNPSSQTSGQVLFSHYCNVVFVLFACHLCHYIAW